MSALKLLITIYYLLSLYSPTGGQFTGSTASLEPPSSIQSSTNNHSSRYNIIAGSSFTIYCDVRRPSGSFVADFYIDNLTSPITSETLADTTFTKTTTLVINSVIVTLTFNNFQPAHNGRYICQANTTDGSESTRIGQALYGTGAITVTPVTPRYQVYDSNEEIYVEVQIRGEFYDISWIYDPTDPGGASSGRVTLMLNSNTGVSGDIFRQGVKIATGSSSHQAGYYIPRIIETQFIARPEMATESTLYRTYASPSASLPTLVSQSSGSNLTVTCTATGYPEVTISFTTTDISASNETGDPIATVTATPSAPFTTTRSITFYSITFSDCGTVTCTASNSDGTTTSTSSDTQGVQVTGPPTVTISPLEEQVVGIGDSVTLTCSASDCVGSAFSFVWYRDGSNVSTSGVLTISNVTSSDFGEYTCNVTGEGGTGSATTYISEENSLNLISDLSAPPNGSLHSTVNVGSSEQNQYNIEPDSSFSIVCTFDSPSHYDLLAYKDSSQLLNSSSVLVTVATTTTMSPTRMTKTLTIAFTTFSSPNNGVYQCNATSGDRTLLSRSILIAIPESTTSIQLYLSPVSNCLTWTDANGDSKLSNISERVRSVMTNCPKCNIFYTAGPIFSCLGTDSDQTVVFRAQIVYQYIRDSPTNPLSLLQSWVSSGPLLTVLQQQLRVNSACQVERPLDTAPKCTPDRPISPPPSSSTAIVVTVCVIVVLSTILLVAIVIVLILCIRRWKKDRKAIPVKEEYEYMHTVQGALTGGMVYSTVGDPTEMHKNPAYDTTQGKEGDTEGENVYEGNIISHTTIKEDQPMEEESAYL